jgi:hypothetical protein
MQAIYDAMPPEAQSPYCNGNAGSRSALSARMSSRSRCKLGLRLLAGANGGLQRFELGAQFIQLSKQIGLPTRLSCHAPA